VDRVQSVVLPKRGWLSGSAASFTTAALGVQRLGGPVEKDGIVVLIIFKIIPFRLSPDRMGPLGKPPASLALLPSRASSRTRSCPTPFEHQRRYEAIRVWSFTTFIVIEAGDQQEISGRNLKGKYKINNNHDIHKTQSLIINNHP
jgi:hypothetical protein